LVLSDRNIKAILVNVFAGINRCDWVAEGIVKACHELNVDVPLVVRLSGTNVEAGRDIIGKSGLPIISAETLADAGKAAVDAAKGTPERSARTA
jgi:malate-CoA ligase subunit beta